MPRTRKQEPNSATNHLTHTCPCIGLTDEVLNTEGVPIGYLGFHDYDGYIPILKLRCMISTVANQLHTIIYCLKTGHGYFFISFEIMNAHARRKWARILGRTFPSDYLQRDDQTRHRILRLGRKGKGPKPSFLFASGIKPLGLISLGHLQEYKRRRIISRKALEVFNDCAFQATIPNFCVYLAKERSEK